MTTTSYAVPAVGPRPERRLELGPGLRHLDGRRDDRRLIHPAELDPRQLAVLPHQEILSVIVRIDPPAHTFCGTTASTRGGGFTFTLIALVLTQLAVPGFVTTTSNSPGPRAMTGMVIVMDEQISIFSTMFAVTACSRPSR
jgi:hypothetical protein